jgi:hypothetical protein
MAVITPGTFDPTKNYKLPRLQQGVPLVDADWNELGDALAFELRALLRWFIGDGVPAGSDAFRIDGTGVSNDFTIRSGMKAPPSGATNFDAVLEFAGRCTVDGRQVFVLADFTYTSQPLHVANTGSAALAARLGVPVIVALPTTSGTAAVYTAYLDVWERLVTPSEDPSLILPALGVESCARTKREAVIRTRVGTAAPKWGEADFLAGHSYLAFANINRPPGQGAVNAADVTDVRSHRLTLADLQSRVALVEQLAILPVFATPGSQISPKVGPPAQTITLSGRNFGYPPLEVFFGPTLVPSVTATPFQISFAAPAIAAGTYKITVTTAGGTVVSDDTFNLLPAVPAPAFAAAPGDFSPKVGRPGQVVTLVGSNFNGPNLQVSFGGIEATAGITSVSATQITVTVPSFAPPGPLQIEVVTSGGRDFSTDRFTVIPGPPIS